MYSREEILSLPAGWELNSLVAENVMGWQIGESWGGAYWTDSDKCSRYEVSKFKPSQYIDVAWGVVEMFQTFQVTKTHQVKLPKGPEDMYRAIVQANKFVAHANTPSLAICRAALLASLLKED